MSMIGTTKLTEADVADIRERVQAGETQRSVAERHGVNQSHVSRISQGRHWTKYVSTRATLTIHEGDEAYSVYRHSDGYPDGEHGVLHTLRQAFAYAWTLPRFEAMDFAAAIVAAWKTTGGNIYMTGGRDEHGDTEFHYSIGQLKGQAALYVAVWVPVGDDREWVKLAAFRITPDRVKPLPLSRADAAIMREHKLATEYKDIMLKLESQDEHMDIAPPPKATPAVEPAPVSNPGIVVSDMIERMVDERVKAAMVGMEDAILARIANSLRR